MSVSKKKKKDGWFLKHDIIGALASKSSHKVKKILGSGNCSHLTLTDSPILTWVEFFSLPLVPFWGDRQLFTSAQEKAHNTSIPVRPCNICMDDFMGECVSMCPCLCVCESVLSLCYVNLGDQTLVVSFDSKYLYPLSHLPALFTYSLRISNIYTMYFDHIYLSFSPYTPLNMPPPQI